MSSGFAHQASASFLTGVPGAGRPGFRNAISLDQFAAEHIGGQTRFPSLALSGEGPACPGPGPARSCRRTRSPSQVFARLFLEGRPDEVQAQVRRLEDGRSILDDVRDQAEALRSDLGADDRDKLDEYFTSVRELEQRLVTDEAWSKTPKPKVDVEPPKDIPNAADLIGRTRLLFDLTHLALQTDSTRLVTIMLAGSTYVPPIPGVTLGHHDLSHHGKDPGKLEQLKIVEVETMKTVRDLLAKLKQTQGRGRQPARPDDGLPRQQPGRRQQPLRQEPAGPPGRRRLPARPAPGLRSAEPAAAVQPLREHAPAAGHRGRQVRHQHRNADRPGDGQASRVVIGACDWRDSCHYAGKVDTAFS